MRRCAAARASRDDESRHSRALSSSVVVRSVRKSVHHRFDVHRGNPQEAATVPASRWCRSGGFRLVITAREKALRGVRQHGGELRAVAQMQVPVVGPAEHETRHRGRSSRLRNTGSVSSRDAYRTPKPVNSVGTCARPPLRSLAARSRCTQGSASGTKRLRKRAAGYGHPCLEPHCSKSAIGSRDRCRNPRPRKAPNPFPLVRPMRCRSSGSRAFCYAPL